MNIKTRSAPRTKGKTAKCIPLLIKSLQKSWRPDPKTTLPTHLRREAFCLIVLTVTELPHVTSIIQITLQVVLSAADHFSLVSEENATREDEPFCVPNNFQL